MRYGLLSLTFSVLFLNACGASSAETLPDETSDTSGSETMRATPTVAATIPERLEGSEWRFMEAACTDGELDWAQRGMTAHMRIEPESDGILLIRDESFSDGCARTILTRITPPSQPGDLVIDELTRVALPATPACVGEPEPTHPGELRVNGEFLDVLVQRSRACRGFELRMSFARRTAESPNEAELMRHYSAFFTRGDVTRITRMFAEPGAVLDPFTLTETGDPTRYEGRDAVGGWYAGTLTQTRWRAQRLVAIERDEPNNSWIGRFEYMDPRLTTPVLGHTRFVIAGGEIFEAESRLDAAPALVGGAAQSETPAQPATASVTPAPRTRPRPVRRPAAP